MHKSTNLLIIRKKYKLFFVIFLTNTKKRTKYSPLLPLLKTDFIACVL